MSRVFVAMCVGCFAAVLSAVLPFVLRGAASESADGHVSREEAEHLARVGLIEAVGWLQRQPIQPVPRFTPAASDTEEPSLGLVHEFSIARGVWGRFAVTRVDAPATGVDGPATRVDANEAGERPWRFRSVGYLYRYLDANARFDAAPNEVLHEVVLTVDVIRLGLRPPGQAALCARAGSHVIVGPMGEVLGGADAVGIYYPGGRGTPKTDGGTVMGAVAKVAASTGIYRDGLEDVFGVDAQGLLATADHHITSPRMFDVPIQANALYCVTTPELVFTQERPLRGMGAIYVRGNVTLEAGSESRFHGFLYVDGNLTVRGPAVLRGAVVATGDVLIQGGGGKASLIYDDAVLTAVRRAVGTYRTIKQARRPAHGQ